MPAIQDALIKVGQTRDARCVRAILANAEEYHDAYYVEKTFGGPSLYFHRRAMEFVGKPICDLQLESIYAVLTSWGMHRMGRGGSKMVEFAEFRSSVLSLREEIVYAQTRDFEATDSETWSALKEIFQSLKVMATQTRLVGNSKVMAHLIPGLIPPIDRQYTLKYLRGTTNIVNDCDEEWTCLRNLLEGFFYPLVQDPKLAKQTAKWMAQPSTYPWDTSPLKVIDNLLIGAVKLSLRNPSDN